MKTYTISEDDYQQALENYSGICGECGELRHGDTEPDAEDYPCDSCGENAVVGIENALLSGVVHFAD